jgi:hypothetical protein
MTRERRKWAIASLLVTDPLGTIERALAEIQN